MKNADENKPIAPSEGVNGSETAKRQIGSDQLLSESFDEVLTEVLGSKISSMFWHHWSISLGINRENFSNHLPKLFESIQAIFGNGHRTVGELAVRRAYAKANLPLDYSASRPLLEYAQELKQILEMKDFAARTESAQRESSNASDQTRR